MYEIRHYTDAEGNDLFERWLGSLKDRNSRLKIAVRLVRVANGNFGDCKPVGSGVWELRVHSGPGYRIYYALEREKVVLLCHGGDKSSQSVDVREAVERWNDWKRRGAQ